MVDQLVKVCDLGKTFTKGYPVEALVKASCEVMPGDRIALMGPSGSGKSTLLHLLAGIEKPTRGSIAWPALGPPETLRPQKIGIVFQSQSLLASLTVIENVELPLLLNDAEEDDAHERALTVLQSMELAELANKLPEELSGGQAQRVAIARALAARPQLILADEPTGQLDHATAGHLFDVLLAALEGSSTALVIATHDVSVAERMNKTWQIRHGILEV